MNVFALNEEESIRIYKKSVEDITELAGYVTVVGVEDITLEVREAASKGLKVEKLRANRARENNHFYINENGDGE
jgi:hypothetical protein